MPSPNILNIRHIKYTNALRHGKYPLTLRQNRDCFILVWQQHDVYANTIGMDEQTSA